MKEYKDIIFKDFEELKEAIKYGYIKAPESICINGNKPILVNIMENYVGYHNFPETLSIETIKLIKNYVLWEDIKDEIISYYWFLNKENIGRWVKVITNNFTLLSKFERYNIKGNNDIDNITIKVKDSDYWFLPEDVTLLSKQEVENIINDMQNTIKGEIR